MVYQITNMLVYFEPAAMCEHPNELVLAPLPARKQLWEAADEYAWKAEIDKHNGVQTDYALAMAGDLVELNGDPLHCEGVALLYKDPNAPSSIRKTADWDEWCAGMDSFGGLIMLAASLIK